MERGPRQQWTLARRLTATLLGTALLSTTLAFLVYDRALQRGLRGNAQQRLFRAAQAGDVLIADHLAQLEMRYRSLAGAPQLRATLELGHAPTSTDYADRLRSGQGAVLIAFLDPRGALHARSGDRALAVAARGAHQPGLLSAGGRLYAAVRVPVMLGGSQAHAMLAAEPVDDALLGRWSELCGAPLRIGAPGAGADDELFATPIRAQDGVALFVTADLAPERAALRSARAKLALAGSAALAVTMAACSFLARSLVRPIRQVQEAVAGIGNGAFGTRLGSRRTDEIGEVARGVDRMAEQLLASHGALRARNDELRQSQEHLAKAQRIARLGSFELDLESGELMGSEEFWALYAIEHPGRGKPPSELAERLHPEDRRSVLESVRGSIESGAGAHLDHRILLPDGTERFFQTQFHVIRHPGGGVRLEGTVQDLTEWHRTEQQIRYLAYHDSLTGLGNRQMFSERVELAITQARRNGTKLGVLFLDLDDFKRINDTLGHDVGDELLRDVANRLVRGVREADPVPRELDQGYEPAVARLGGDEFTLLVTDLRDVGDLALVAEHLLHRLRRPYRLQENEIVIHASIGIATWPADGERVETLLSSADSAMYHAKAGARNTYQFYDASMNEVALRRLAVEVRLRQALEQGALALHFQPKLELASGRIVGFEALARWQDDELGVVSPADFVPVAEQTGLIAPLGRWVLAEVCRHVSRVDAKLARSEARVSFNVSAREFGPGFARDIATTLQQYGVNPQRLQLEITETAIMRDERAVVAALEDLRALGLSIALDDFGTGYSSLSYLRRLPVDTLKMDGSFIRSIERDAEAAALTRSIVAMGKALGLRVIAEGVETAEQHALLGEWGCDEIQGFLVGKPLPVEEALARLSPRVRRARR